MKKIFRIMVLFMGASLFLLDNAALASQWQIVGPRAIGMGGAHVAVVNDATAQYWNPAAFGFFGRQAADDEKSDEHSDRDFGIHIHGGLGYQSHEDIIGELEDVTQFDYQAISDDIDGTDGTPGFSNYSNVAEYLRMIGELEDLSRENIAVTALVDVSANIRFRTWGIGMMSTLDVSAVPKLDLYNVNPETGVTDMPAEFLNIYTDTGANNNLDSLTPQQFSNLSSYISSLPNWDGAETAAMIYTLDDAIASDPDITPEQIQAYVDAASAAARIADNAVGGGSFDSNTSVLEFRGAAITEVPLTYGHAFNDNFSLGVNVKAMKAKTYYYRALIYNSDTDNVFEDVIEDQYEESSAVGVDLGALYKTGGLRFGLVARNINKPSFDFAGPGDYEVDTQVRAGLSYRLWNRLTIAADLDLTENDTNVSDDYKSKNMGIGLEADLWVLNLRAGTYKNLSESDIGPVYTAGLGVDLYLFQLDAGVAWSKDKVEVEGDELREEIRGELALSFQY